MSGVASSLLNIPHRSLFDTIAFYLGSITHSLSRNSYSLDSVGKQISFFKTVYISDLPALQSSLFAAPHLHNQPPRWTEIRDLVGTGGVADEAASVLTAMKITNANHLAETIPVRLAIGQPKPVAQMTDVEYGPELNTLHPQSPIPLPTTVIIQSTHAREYQLPGNQ